MEYGLRLRFHRWLLKVSGVPENEKLPRWLIFCFALLFPIQYLVIKAGKNHGFQAETDTWKVFGKEFTSEFFLHMAFGSDEVFRIVSRENGLITIEKLIVQNGKLMTFEEYTLSRKG